jgi:hypothetical protein
MPTTASPEAQLSSFIEKFTPEIATLTHALLAKMRKRYPTAIELVYDNYNALAIGFSPTERPSDGIFSLAVYPRWINLFFLQGKTLADPKHLLKGNGNVVRHVVLPSVAALDDKDLLFLMKQATISAHVPFPSKGEHHLIIKSISAKQRPRRPPVE